MLGVDTLLTALYVMIDDLCQLHQTQRSRPGPDASLCCSEVITLSIFGRWSRFASERDFYRYAEAHLKEAFPTLPDRSQFNRLVRSYAEDIDYIAVKLGQINGRRRTSLPGSGRLGDAHQGRKAPRSRLACRLRRHRLVQQSGLVRGVLAVDLC